MRPWENKKNGGPGSQLKVPFRRSLQYDSPIGEITALLDGEKRIPIGHVPWKNFPYKPDVRFSIVHLDNCLLLKYFVEEKAVVAAHGTTHSAVYKDSCVEFFLSFDKEGYYNLEFNCTGTCLAAFGKGRDERKSLPAGLVDRIRRQAMIDRECQAGVIRWTLTLVIPLDIFALHNLSSVSGLECRANFYKCGDDLPEPHYLAWSDINTTEPDFHQPLYFGKLHFERGDY